MSARFWTAKLPLTTGYLTLIILLGGAGIWSVQTQIAGAVVASGTVEVESQTSVVQHPDGGVVAGVFARDGDTVAAGDILVRLDGTFLTSELAIIEQQLLEMFARKQRLIAERDSIEGPSFEDHPRFITVHEDERTAQFAGQENLFLARQSSLQVELDQLNEQKRQVEQQIEGIEAQRSSVDAQLELIEAEVADVQSLFDRGLVETSRLMALRRQQASLQGDMGRLTSTIAEGSIRISTLELEGLRLRDARREAAIANLRDVQLREMELKERRLSLMERLSRLEVRAPINGVVFDSRVLAQGAVVSPAEQITSIVPGDQPLQVAVRIQPTDIEQIFVGQDVRLIFTTFNSRTTPEIPGQVLLLAADVQTDQTTGAHFYEAIVGPDNEALARLENVELLPGMPVEAFMTTSNRTPLSYLVQPLATYVNRAFRED